MAPRIAIWTVILVVVAAAPGFAIDSTSEIKTHEIREAIDRGCTYLLRQQQSSGEFPSDGLLTHPIGVTSLATLALLDCGIPTASPPMQQSLKFLEKMADNESIRTHDLALLTLAIVAAHEPRYLPKIKVLTEQLASRQLADGGWGASASEAQSHPNLSQLSILALRESTSCGIPASDEVWKQGRRYWQTTQRSDGGWYDIYRDPIRGEEPVGAFAQTLTALSALSTCQRMLEISDAAKASRFASSQKVRDDTAFQRGVDWLNKHVTTQSDPGRTTTTYLLGLERAGRLETAFLREDLSWYQDGAALLLRKQDLETGSWRGNNNVVQTSHALLFLARGLAPVIINNVVDEPSAVPSAQAVSISRFGLYGPGSLAKFISGRTGWPTALVSQDIPVGVVPELLIRNLKQAPVVLITGRIIPKLGTAEKAALKSYLAEGGLLLGSPQAGDPAFEAEFQHFIEEVMPTGLSKLSRLDPDHSVFHADFAIPFERRELYAVDAGCRSSILYCPIDLPGHWALAGRYAALTDDKLLADEIHSAVEIGTNILAYASGKEPPGRMEVRVEHANPAVTADRNEIRIGHLTLSHVPRVARSIQQALRENAGLDIAVEPVSLRADDGKLHEFPLLMMHGKEPLALSDSELKKLKTFLDRGGVLFVDACCGSEAFDRSFRKTVAELFPADVLQTIPVDHNIFSIGTAHDLRQLKHQFYDVEKGRQIIENTPPLLEVITRNGRFQVIYSRRDITCALEQPLVLGCNGYLPADAVRITTNVVMEALLQQVHMTDSLRP